jgi:Rps23 Pro-64 3,4-dihydroxylase Tpa1-like proline 4-hydroxylase
MVNIDNIEKSNNPFDHYVIDNFLPEKHAIELSKEFYDFDSNFWFFYNNKIENKKTLNSWDKFPPKIYSMFMYFCSSEFVDILKSITGIKNLYPDYGLHGGGLHIHGNKGKLNIHKDYSIHPKVNLQRKLNLIFYLGEGWDPSWGGSLEFWSHDFNKNTPKEMVTSIPTIFNRAVLFDTTQNSWHGLPEEINCPSTFYRKSLAMYYLTDIDHNIENRNRALFVPTKEQENDLEIIKFIEQRSKLQY